MKALVCKAFGPLQSHAVSDWDPGAPGAGKVRIAVRAAAVNFPDGLMVQGLYQVKPPVPFVPGSECAGVVEAVGDGVTGIEVGDRVLAYVGTGAFAEACVCDAWRVVKLPEDMSFDEGAALLLTYGTSLHALRTVAGLKAGESLVVLGAAGGVGVASIEIGKALGAKVIAVASTAEKLDLCRQLGADEVINYSDEPLKDRINALTGGAGADVVFDAVGGPHTESAFRALAWEGRLLVVGFASGQIPSLPANLALLKERKLLGVFWGEAVKRDPAGHAENVRQLMAWHGEGLIRPHISATFPLDRAVDALEHVAGRLAVGKVVINP